MPLQLMIVVIKVQTSVALTCKEWKIPVESTVIPIQIQDDITLSTDENIALELDIAPELVAEQKPDS
jgi:hypothetical protein